MSSDLSKDSLKPVTPKHVPTAQKNMIASVKENERLAVTAILQRDKSLAVRALMTHPLVGSNSLAKTLVEAYLDDKPFTDRQYPPGLIPRMSANAYSGYRIGIAAAASAALRAEYSCNRCRW